MDNFNKQPEEIFTIELNFSNNLDSNLNEVISTYANEVTLCGEDVTSEIILDASNNNNSTFLKLQGGLNGGCYKITSRVTTSLSNVYEKDVQMNVKEL